MCVRRQRLKALIMTDAINRSPGASATCGNVEIASLGMNGGSGRGEAVTGGYFQECRVLGGLLFHKPVFQNAASMTVMTLRSVHDGLGDFHGNGGSSFVARHEEQQVERDVLRVLKPYRFLGHPGEDGAEA